MGWRDGKVRVDCKVHGEVGRALKIEVPDGPSTRTVFVPTSQVSEIHKQEGYIVIAEWFAKKESLL
jgi:hypothetical protein